MDFGGIPPARRSPLRPGAGRRPPLAPGFGLPCPDAGYALLLAHLTGDDVVLEPGEERQDADWAMATVAMRRAGVLGRAPCVEDVKIARTLLAYDGSEALFSGPMRSTGKYASNAPSMWAGVPDHCRTSAASQVVT